MEEMAGEPARNKRRFDKLCMPQMGLILQNQDFLANACQEKFQLLSCQSVFRVLYLGNKSVPANLHFPFLSYGSFLFVVASYSSRN